MKNRIAVATDFSQNSLIAISKALYLAKKSTFKKMNDELEELEKKLKIS